MYPQRQMRTGRRDSRNTWSMALPHIASNTGLKPYPPIMIRSLLWARDVFKMPSAAKPVFLHVSRLDAMCLQVFAGIAQGVGPWCTYSR